MLLMSARQDLQPPIQSATWLSPEAPSVIGACARSNFWSRPEGRFPPYIEQPFAGNLAALTPHDDEEGRGIAVEHLCRKSRRVRPRSH